MSQWQQSSKAIDKGYYRRVFIFTVHCRSFESPSPQYRLVADAASTFIAAVNKSLKSGVNTNCKIEIKFRTDVFRYLFNNKGRKPTTGRGLFYNLDDFDTTYFTDNWYDKLGDGCTIDFPVRLESKLKWSSVVYNCTGNVKPRVFSEIVCATLVKTRC